MVADAFAGARLVERGQLLQALGREGRPEEAESLLGAPGKRSAHGTRWRAAPSLLRLQVGQGDTAQRPDSPRRQPRCGVTQWHPLFAKLLRPLVEGHYEVQINVPVGEAPRCGCADPSAPARYDRGAGAGHAATGANAPAL